MTIEIGPNLSGVIVLSIFIIAGTIFIINILKE